MVLCLSEKEEDSHFSETIVEPNFATKLSWSHYLTYTHTQPNNYRMKLFNSTFIHRNIPLFVVTEMKTWTLLSMPNILFTYGKKLLWPVNIISFYLFIDVSMEKINNIDLSLHLCRSLSFPLSSSVFFSFSTSQIVEKFLNHNNMIYIWMMYFWRLLWSIQITSKMTIINVLDLFWMIFFLKKTLILFSFRISFSKP